MTGCATCAGHAGRLTQSEQDVARLARRCAANDTPRNRALVAKAIRNRDYERNADRFCARCDTPQTPAALPLPVRNTTKENHP